MEINRDYLWFRLFKTPSIGPKLLASISKILEKHQIDLEMLPRSKSALSTEFPELAKILDGKIREEDSEKAVEEYNQLRELGVEIIYPGIPIFYPIFLKFHQYCLLRDNENISDQSVLLLLGLGMCPVKESS